MYCPQCGQKQLTEDVRFCSQCGLPLTEVTDLLARGRVPGAPVEQAPPPKEVSPRKKGLKQGVYMILTVIVLVILLAVTAADDDAIAAIAMLGFAAAILRMLYALVFQRTKPRHPVSAPLGPPPNLAQAPQRGGLPPANTTPVAVPRTRFDTGEIVPEPPSVTEHTTRHLEQEHPRDREH